MTELSALHAGRRAARLGRDVAGNTGRCGGAKHNDPALLRDSCHPADQVELLAHDIGRHCPDARGTATTCHVLSPRSRLKPPRTAAVLLLDSEAPRLLTRGALRDDAAGNVLS